MCIIMSKPAGKKIPQEHISNSHANNRDGVGIMYAEDGVVKIETHGTIQQHHYFNSSLQNVQ